MNTLNNVISIDLPANKQSSIYQNERDYKEAIYNFEKRLTEQPKCVATLREWIMSYHKLAAMYVENGEVEVAQKCLFIPHQSMLYMAKESHGDSDQEQIAMSAINLTLPPLIEFAKQYPPCQSCMEQLQSQLAAIKLNSKAKH